MGTHLRVLSENFPMNTNMTGFRWFPKNLCVLVLWTKVASALEGLSVHYQYLRLFGESCHDDHDVIGDVLTRLQGDRLTDDAATRLRNGCVRQRTNQQPGEQANMADAIDELFRTGSKINFSANMADAIDELFRTGSKINFSANMADAINELFRTGSKINFSANMADAIDELFRTGSKINFSANMADAIDELFRTGSKINFSERFNQPTSTILNANFLSMDCHLSLILLKTDKVDISLFKLFISLVERRIDH